MVDTGLTSKSGSNSMTTYSINRYGERVEEVQKLLPGILDEITVNEIATKLPWMTFYTLSLVSRRWYAAIKSRQISQARWSSRCTPVLFAFQPEQTNSRPGLNSCSIYTRVATNPGHQIYLRTCKDINRVWTLPNCYCLFLYSPDEGSVYQLPPIPGFYGGGPRNCEVVFVDGKVYALGGNRIHSDYSNVHVFDLLGRGQWKSCASMKDYYRQDFHCEALENGKIYVCGGIGVDKYKKAVISCEVYDPVKDFWSPITSDETKQIGHDVIPVGEEFLYPNRCGYGSIYGNDPPKLNSFAYFYHPAKDQWRWVKYFPREVLYKVHWHSGRAHIDDSLVWVWLPLLM